jgi:hypothetical protein
MNPNEETRNTKTVATIRRSAAGSIGEVVDTIKLHFHGPLTFTPGDRSLFHSPFASVRCVYLWTFRSDSDGCYYIHYVGEAKSFAARQREHLIHILGMNYGTFDPAAARGGVQTQVWPGLWRDKSPDGPGRLLERYEANTKAVLQYVAALEVFVGETSVEMDLRRHIEGSIGWNLGNNHADKKMLYPDDNRVHMRQKVGRRLRITADAVIAGVDEFIRSEASTCARPNNLRIHAPRHPKPIPPTAANSDL